MSVFVPPPPGRGAAVLATPTGKYVYVVRSRRSGAVSIGIDLTPEGACPFDCDYCQVPRDRRTTPSIDVDLLVLQRELDDAMKAYPEARDVTFAGSGEPTWSSAFRSAFALAMTATKQSAIPVVVYTSGALLGRPNVRDALASAIGAGAATVWVKLDAWDEESMLRIAGMRGQAVHEERILLLARQAPVGTQTLLAHRSDGWTVAETARGLSTALARLRFGGAMFNRGQLTTLLRPPGRASDLRPFAANEVATVADAFREVGVEPLTPALLEPLVQSNGAC